MPEIPTAHHLYVVEFTDGVVKVGRTSRLRQRINQHTTDASDRGAERARSWASHDHTYEDALEGEQTLINFCREQWRAAWGREYFAGADFDEVADYGHGIDQVLLMFAGRLTPVA
jgi:predicted GIY-YIG superfamily endonuclease